MKRLHTGSLKQRAHKPSPFEREFFGLRHTSRVIPKAKRPKCQQCGKTLALVTPALWFGRFMHDTLERSQQELKNALAWSSVEMENGEPRRLGVWCGAYEGYGWNTMQDNQPIFCSTKCAVRYASRAYNNRGVR